MTHLRCPRSSRLLLREELFQRQREARQDVAAVERLALREDDRLRHRRMSPSRFRRSSIVVGIIADRSPASRSVGV